MLSHACICADENLHMYVKNHMHTIILLLLECLQRPSLPPSDKTGAGRETEGVGRDPVISPTSPRSTQPSPPCQPPLLWCLQRHPCHSSNPVAQFLLFFPNAFQSSLTSSPCTALFVTNTEEEKKKRQRQEIAWWGVALLTISTAWCKSGALFHYSVNAGSVPNCLLWQIQPSFSAVTKGNGIFLFHVLEVGTKACGALWV